MARAGCLASGRGKRQVHSRRGEFVDAVRDSRVRQGETIAFVGSTGYSTGAHLYYELRINGRNVDPLRVRLRAGRMLDGAALDAFETKRDRADLLLRTATADGEPAAVRSETSAQPQRAQPQEPWWAPVAPLQP